MNSILEEKCSSNRVAWGMGRVAFLANRPTIQELLDKGWHMTTVYQRVKDSLAGLSYRQFINHACKYCSLPFKRSAIKQDVTKLPAGTPKWNIATTNQHTIKKEQTSMPMFRGFEPGPKVPDLDELF